MFMIAYSPGEGPVPFTYSSECSALYVRDLAMSLFTATTWFFNFLLAVTFPSFLDSYGNFGAFAWYAAWNVVGWVLIMLFVPETANQSLEELDARFDLPSSTHAAHGIKQVKYVGRRYLLRQRHVEKPKLDVQSLPVALNVSGPPRKIPVEYDEERFASVTGTDERF